MPKYIIANGKWLIERQRGLISWGRLDTPCLLKFLSATACSLFLLATGCVNSLNGRNITPCGNVGLREACAALDAIQAELFETGICSGGEIIEAGISSPEPCLLAIVYRVPGQLQIYREAYIQSDGTLWLADDLVSHKDEARRWCVKPVPDAEFQRLFAEAPLRFVGRLNEALTNSEVARHAERERRKLEALRQP